jgi:hypothetical protein
MIKRKILMISFTLILIAGILCGSTAVTAQDSASSSPADKCSETDLSNEAVYVSRDGGETWSTVDDKLVDKLSNQDFEDKFKIGEEEASIVHEVPPCPIIIDGVLYQPEQIHLFDGQRLGFTTDNEGKQLHAFTTEEGIEEFQNEMAQNDNSEAPVGIFFRDGEIQNLVPGKEVNGILMINEEEARERSQMSLKTEAAIVHEVPPCPVIIDGVLYEPEQIHLFDGQRLGFTVGNDGRLYAFTDERELEIFINKQVQASSDEDNVVILDTLSHFYEDWYYSGYSVGCAPGYGFATLGPLDNEISSFIANSAPSNIRLYEDTYLQGDYFERPGGTNISTLFLFGWNDRASSVFAYE